MTHKTMIFKNCIILLLGLFIGCSSANKPRLPENSDPVIGGELSEEKARGTLETKLANQMRFAEENKESFKKQVVSVPSGEFTYYYKYYDEFPEEKSVSISISPGDTVLAPAYTANVKYRKVRYQTRYTKSQAKAEDDNDFIRDEGFENDVYEFVDGKWRLKSSVFEVTKTSIYKDDRWTVMQGRIKRTEEEKPEYFVDKVRTLFGLLD
ncbi:MAG: hypothetical protein HY801_12090 [Candidatus Lindowbacteria bacterium]|nr:hypothetical protein [Candidatus Lindowbacteria bacterium]